MILTPDLHDLEESPDFPALLALAKAEDREIEDISVTGFIGIGACADGVLFRNVHFRRCRFSDADFRRAQFSNVQFTLCDFSGAKLEGAYFSRCLFAECKAVGAGLEDARFRDVRLEDSNLSYAVLAGGQWKDAALLRCDCTYAALSGMQVKDVTFTETDFTRADFGRTALRGINLATCTLDAVLLSEGLPELKGATVSPLQALQFARLLGLIIAPPEKERRP